MKPFWTPASTANLTRLARQLRELARVRQWVVGLPRPKPPADVSAPVLIRIAAQPPLWLRLLGWRRVAASRSFAVGTRLASAAALVLILTLPCTPTADPVKPKPIQETTLFDTPPIPPDLWNPPESAVLAESTDSNDSKPTPSAHPEPQPSPTVVVNLDVERRHQAGRRRLVALLDRPDVQRVFEVVESLDGPSRSLVEEALHRSPRRSKDYGPITPVRRFAVDPERPGEAIVFAMTVDTHERTQLTDTLEQSFAGCVIVEPGSAPPPVVTLLADMGQIDFLDEPVPIKPPEAESSRGAGVVPPKLNTEHPDLNPSSDGPCRKPPVRAGVKGQETDWPVSGNRSRPRLGRLPLLRARRIGRALGTDNFARPGDHQAAKLRSDSIVWLLDAP